MIAQLARVVAAVASWCALLIAFGFLARLNWELFQLGWRALG